jgi:hypothetical protein
MSERRLPPPWSTKEGDNYFVVRDREGQQLAYVYFEDELGGFNTTVMSRRRSSVAV